MSYDKRETTYQAMGAEDGIRRPVDRLYHIMERDYATLFAMHPA